MLQEFTDKLRRIFEETTHQKVEVGFVGETDKIVYNENYVKWLEENLLKQSRKFTKVNKLFGKD